MGGFPLEFVDWRGRFWKRPLVVAEFVNGDIMRINWISTFVVVDF